MTKPRLPIPHLNSPVLPLCIDGNPPSGFPSRTRLLLTVAKIPGQAQAGPKP